MIDERTQQWVESLSKGGGIQSLIVELEQLPMEEMQKLKTRRERIDLAVSCVEKAIEPVLAEAGLSRESVKVLGALGQAIIQAAPEKLRELIKRGGVLAEAHDLKVMPNVLMPAVASS
jgi:hypothetical protein